MTMAQAARPDDADQRAFALDAVRFEVAGRVLLHPLTLTIPAGRVVGLLGENGSGKSTLLKILARQQAPTGGRVRFAGRSLDSGSDRAFARAIGYLPQDTPRTGGLRVRELVALGRYPWHGALGRFSSADGMKVAEAMALTGIEILAERDVDTLSGGERQRAWLAMLVAQDARCLLLDEPISALDVAHQVEVLALIRRLCDSQGLGVLVVLHEVNLAARFCDEIIALKAGRLVAKDTPDRLMTPERLGDIYGVGMSLVRHPVGGYPVALVN
jgi:iron complex transport system ATP-binding protein